MLQGYQDGGRSALGVTRMLAVAGETMDRHRRVLQKCCAHPGPAKNPARKSEPAVLPSRRKKVIEYPRCVHLAPAPFRPKSSGDHSDFMRSD